MVTGSYPPKACGVGDYTNSLVGALRTIGCDVDVMTDRDFKLFNARNLAKEISLKKPDIVHIQYPTSGYGSDLGPQMLSVLMRGCVVTLHEVSQVNLLRRLSLYPFSIRSSRLIFTNTYERDYAEKHAPWLGQRTSVIPIGSAIQFSSQEQERDSKEIVHFGLIRPKKGIEEVLNLARVIKKNSQAMRIRIIGMVEPRFEQYFQDLKEAANGLPVSWSIGLPEAEVAALLSRAETAYMPFPDGASERRSSLLALLANEVVTITTLGLFTPSEMDGVVEFAATPHDAFTIINNDLSNAEKKAAMTIQMRKYMQRRQWSEIAAAHKALYQLILGDKH
jgi:glycosyltransferase involved in cell wall biosynthesis